MKIYSANKAIDQMRDKFEVARDDRAYRVVHAINNSLEYYFADRFTNGETVITIKIPKDYMHDLIRSDLAYIKELYQKNGWTVRTCWFYKLFGITALNFSIELSRPLHKKPSESKKTPAKVPLLD